jgi:dipeptidyl-peptidase-4
VFPLENVAMRRHFVHASAVLTVFILLTDAAQAQQPLKQSDTSYLRTLAETRAFMLGRPSRPTPTPDGKAILFLRSAPRAAKLGLFECDVSSGKTRQLVTPAQILKGAEEKLSPEEKAQRERMRVSVGGFTSFELSHNGRLILLSLSGRLYIFERDTRAIRELATGQGPLLDPQFSPDGAKVSYVRDNDVHVLDLASQKATRVTTGGTEMIPHGLAEFVAQEEMARFNGYWWSPDSKQIAYQETDHRGVEVWHVADPAYPGREPQSFFYPRPGKPNARVKLGIVPVSGGKTTWVAWDDVRYPYLATVRWPKDAPLLLVVQTRDQKEMVLLEADPQSGKSKPLLIERSKTWVNIHQDVPKWLPDGKGFLWVSERAGPQLEVRNREGKLRRVLVPQEMGFDSLLSVDAKGEQLAFTASADPTEMHVYRLNLRDIWADPQRLTTEPGLHTGVFSWPHGFHVLTSRLLKSMPKTTVRNADGKLIAELPSVAEEPPRNPLVELTTIGDSKFHAAVVWPRYFDETKRYPVLVDVYGGPGFLHVAASMNRWLLDQWYADQGFIVVSIDGRGTPGRGSDWESAIYESFASVPLRDQIEALKALAVRYPAMDLDRVGIDGWSFGGYLAALAVLRRPDVFRAGVAGAPVCDWFDYDTHYTERYLGVPADRDDPVYKANSLLAFAPNLKRPLLLMHGTADDNVYFRHSLRLADGLFRHGKEFEMLPLSGLTHMVPDPVVMENLHGRIARFLQKHLGGPQ